MTFQKIKIRNKILNCLEEKLTYYLSSADSILISRNIKDGRETVFTKLATEFLNDNSIVKNNYLDFKQISVGADFILINSQTKDDIDSKVRKMIQEINLEISKTRQSIRSVHRNI